MAKIETGFIDANGASFYYEVSGEGEALILVHAGVGDGRMWDDQFPVFAQHYKTVRFDARGYGKTRAVPGDYWPFEDIRGVMDALRIEKAHLLGCSMGGEASIDFALAYPDRVLSLIPVCAALSGFDVRRGLDEQGKRMMDAYNAGDLDTTAEVLAEIWVDGPNRSPDQVDPVVRNKVKEMQIIPLKVPDGLGEEQPPDRPAVDRLGEITAPVLVIVGALDQPTILEVADLLARQVKGAKNVVIEGAAHVPSMEKPDELNRIVLEFLGGL